MTVPVPRILIGISAVRPGSTAPALCPTRPVTGSSAVTVNAPAFTSGKEYRPCSSVTTFTSLSVDESKVTTTSLPTGVTPSGWKTVPLTALVATSWSVTLTVSPTFGIVPVAAMTVGLKAFTASTVKAPTKTLSKAKVPDATSLLMTRVRWTDPNPIPTGTHWGNSTVTSPTWMLP